MTDPSSLRKVAKARGLKLKLKDDLYSLFEGSLCVYGPAPHKDARQFLAKIEPLRSRGRQKGFKPVRVATPGASKPTLILGPKAYVMAKRFDYRLKVEGGLIRLRIGDDVIFESRDPQRLRLFFNSAAQGLVRIGPRAVEAETARREAVLAKAAAAEERAQRAAERKKEKEARSRAAKMAQALKPGDPGLASPDHTPKDAGLVLTQLELPAGFDGEFALISLWVAENMNTAKAAPAVVAKIGEAKALLAKKSVNVEIFLSGHDRASLARYPAPFGVVLAAAALARNVQRARGQ